MCVFSTLKKSLMSHGYWSLLTLRKIIYRFRLLSYGVTGRFRREYEKHFRNTSGPNIGNGPTFPLRVMRGHTGVRSTKGTPSKLVQINPSKKVYIRSKNIDI